MTKHTLIALVLSLVAVPLCAQSAQVTQVGSAGSLGGTTNLFESSAPLIGAQVGMQLTDGRPGTVGFLVLSDVPATTTQAFGHTVYVDLAKAFVAEPFVLNVDGYWSLVATLNLPQSVAGSRVRLQVLTADYSSDVGPSYETSNALEWVLGS